MVEDTYHGPSSNPQGGSSSGFDNFVEGNLLFKSAIVDAGLEFGQFSHPDNNAINTVALPPGQTVGPISAVGYNAVVNVKFLMGWSLYGRLWLAHRLAKRVFGHGLRRQLT